MHATVPVNLHHSLTPPPPPCQTQLERALSVAVLGLVPAAVFAPSLPTDMAIATLLPLHNHLGMNVVITDYVHHPTMLSIANILNVVVGVATVRWVGLALPANQMCLRDPDLFAPPPFFPQRLAASSTSTSTMSASARRCGSCGGPATEPSRQTVNDFSWL